MIRKCSSCELDAGWWGFIKGKPVYACSQNHLRILRKHKDFTTDLFRVFKVSEEKE